MGRVNPEKKFSGDIWMSTENRSKTDLTIERTNITKERNVEKRSKCYGGELR